MTGGRTTLRLLPFGTFDAAVNMAIDAYMLRECEDDPRRGWLRFYCWSRPSLSLGYFEDGRAIDRARALGAGVDIVRRPTGGRAVLHGDDLTYSLVLPGRPGIGAAGVYKMVSRCLVRGFRSLGIALDLGRGRPGKSDLKNKPCFVSASRYEITGGGRKVVGSAQRAGERCVLQHGSMPLGQGYLDVVSYMALGPGERERLLADLEASTACLNELAGRRIEAREAAAALAGGFEDLFDMVPAVLGSKVFDAHVASLAQGFRKAACGSKPFGTKPLDSISSAFI